MSRFSRMLSVSVVIGAFSMTAFENLHINVSSSISFFIGSATCFAGLYIIGSISSMGKQTPEHASNKPYFDDQTIDKTNEDQNPDT